MGFRDIYREVKCRDGSTRLVIRKPQNDIPKVFSEYVPEWEFKISLGLKAAKEIITGNGSAEVKKTAKKLYDKINDIDATALTLFKMRYLQYTTNACDKDAVLDSAIDEIVKNILELTRINKELEAILAKSKTKAEEKIDVEEEMPEIATVETILTRIKTNLASARKRKS